MLKGMEIVDDKIAESLKKKTPAERLEMAFNFWHSATVLLSNCLKSLHPEWNEERIRKELIRRLSHGAI